MTDTNPRDLIKRLADALHDAADDVRGWGDYASSYFQEKHDLRGNVARIYAEAAEAYAYLDQPDPSLTVQDCKKQALQALNDAVKMADYVPPEGISSDQADIIRRALGPLSEEPTDPELTSLDQPEPEEEWYSRFGDWFEREIPEGTVIDDPLWWASKIADYLARAVLSHWGSPALKAVPVIVRLPKPEDCDAKGRCWGWVNAEYGWNLYPPEHLPEWSFWLPHWALPVPTK